MSKTLKVFDKRYGMAVPVIGGAIVDITGKEIFDYDRITKLKENLDDLESKITKSIMDGNIVDTTNSDKFIPPSRNKTKDLVLNDFIESDPTFKTPGLKSLIRYDVNFEATKTAFFGECDSRDLINATDLSIKIGFSQGTILNNEIPWLKFLNNKKILYVAKKHYKSNISYSNLETLNLINGSKVIDIDGLKFKVRILKGRYSDVKDYLNDNSEYPKNNLSYYEWDRLILPLIGNTKYMVEKYYKDYKYKEYITSFNMNYSIEDLDLENYTLCQEKFNETIDKCIISNYKEKKNIDINDENQYWRPVLEYIKE